MNSQICAGVFQGGEIEPGTFHRQFFGSKFLDISEKPQGEEPSDESTDEKSDGRDD